MGSPVGPTGATLTCSGEQHVPEGLTLRVGASQSWSSTELAFSDGLDGALRRRAESASVEVRVHERLTLQAGAGASIGGDLDSGGVRYRLGPGPVVVLGGAYRVLDGRGVLPFLLFGVGASLSTVETRAGEHEARMTAVDARFSLTAGKLLFERIAPFVTVRGFGGPIFWTRGDESVTGTDRHHFQVGGGILATTGRVDAFFEIVPLGERAVTLGLAVGF